MSQRKLRKERRRRAWAEAKLARKRSGQKRSKLHQIVSNMMKVNGEFE